MFAAGNVKFAGPELVKILLDNNRQNNCVSQKQPLRTTDSKVFLVDTNKLTHHDDIKADDLGSWRNDGQHSRWVKVKETGSYVLVNLIRIERHTAYIDTTLCTILTPSLKGRLLS